MTEFTALLDKSDKGNLAVHVPDLQAPLAELWWQLKRIEVLFWFQARVES